MRYTNYAEVIKRAKSGQPVQVSVAAAHDEDVLAAVKRAGEIGLVVPILVGNSDAIKQKAEQIGFDIGNYEIRHAETDEESAYLAAKLADEGVAQIIMKGFINSTPFLKGVLHRDFALRTDRILSHISAFEIPGVPRLIYLSDGGLNIAPTVEQKAQILRNAVDFLIQIGMQQPKAALLSANEQVNDKMPVTVDCKILAEQSKAGAFGPAVVEGPLPLDLAISKESLLHKGIVSEIGGEADLLLVPSIEAGNLLGKAITYFANGVMAGVVLGAKVPLVLNSRSDSADAKLASLALAALTCQQNSSEETSEGAMRR